MIVLILPADAVAPNKAAQLRQQSVNEAVERLASKGGSSPPRRIRDIGTRVPIVELNQATHGANALFFVFFIFRSASSVSEQTGKWRSGR
jgi:hypothetical protein